MKQAILAVNTLLYENIPPHVLRHEKDKRDMGQG